MGQNYYYGNGVEQDYIKAAEWFRKAAEQGDTEAQEYLGGMYYHGKGVEQDYVKAAEWYEKAAEQGNDGAQRQLGYMYVKAQGVEQDYVKAAEWYEKAAEQGDHWAQYYLGCMYYYGKGVKEDHAKAIEWLKKAAEQGNSMARNGIKELPKNGDDVFPDNDKVVESLEKAAEQGEATAQLRLGVMYKYGEGVKRNYTKAAKWIRKAANQGEARAQFSLGELYENGKGVKQDYAKAAKWTRKAAKQGYLYAEKRIGEMYENGEGVPQDFDKALEWYKKTVKHGYSAIGILLMRAPADFPLSILRELVYKAKNNDNKLLESDINDILPVSIKTPRVINFIKEYLQGKGLSISSPPNKPVSYVLYCNNPGSEFKVKINASNISSSFSFFHDSYCAELKGIISDRLREQGIEKFLNSFFTEDEVPACGHFRFVELRTQLFGNGELSINEKVKIYLDSIMKNGKIIKTEEIDIKDYVDFDSEKEYLMDNGLWNATDEYIEIAIEKFVKETGWHFALEKVNDRIEDVALWPSPKENGTWIDKDGVVMHPHLWYGYNDGRALTEEEDRIWSIDNGLDFWFSENPEDFIIEYEDYRFAGYFNGIIPDIKAIRESCPILLEADDTPESIEEKVQAFCIKQYRKAHPKAAVKDMD